tara:strand:- start:257337 stop:259205 length:1869 start_codon:yes stop_codon:yes gene_type:complete
MSAADNAGQSDFIAFMDSDDGVMNADGTNMDVDLPFRVRWHIPNWVHDGQWHDLAIPLPPATKAGLDSAKAGLTLAGDSLEVEVDSLFMNWYYEGAWANGSGTGHWDESDPYWTEFDWEAVKFFGRHVDYADGGSPFFFDYFTIGVKPDELAALNVAPNAITGVEVNSDAGVNTITWPSSADAGGYKIYFSENEITDLLADGVSLIASKTFEDDLAVDHTLEAPHPDLAKDFTAYYAVTATSEFGKESAPATVSSTSDIKVIESYVAEMDNDAIDAMFDAIDNETIPESSVMAGYFPDGYTPFTINQDRYFVEAGLAPDDDADLSAKFWIGYGEEFNDLIIYSEITDESIVIASESIGSAGAWSYDSYELGIGNYHPESFIISSTHATYSAGDEPDYQLRGGLFSDRAPFIQAWDGGITGGYGEGEIPNSLSIGEETETGWRMLTLISTVSLSLGEGNTSRAFDFPSSDSIQVYPFQAAVNDADDATRETQLGWSNRGGDGTWYNTPTKWQTIAFVGANRFPTGTSNEVDGDTPVEFSLEQNYPNPFNPTTNISFTLGNSTDVTLEVYNMLGQKVATLLQNEKLAAGSHTQAFNAANLASGMYLYRLSTPSFVKSRKMMLIK